jgi:demethylmenaquinone methyltransferase/2-methoxy-6-polyprenyl-1,4-benzoquinol methylase
MAKIAAAPSSVPAALFAPLGPTYDRYARLFSLGQDPRWRRFLVSQVDVRPGDRVLDVATGTAAVAIELARRKGCHVVGVDRSPEMLAEGRARVAAAGLADRIELVSGLAEELPFEDAAFAALTFTYLLRYVDDPPATLRELARVVAPGGTVASLEFAIPPRSIPRALWELYVRIGLPAAGRLISPGWAEVGRFLGPSIRDFNRRLPLPAVVELWRRAGVEEVDVRRMSLGGGVVIWGRKASRSAPTVRSAGPARTPSETIRRNGRNHNRKRPK